MLVSLTRCLRYWDDLSREADERVVSVGLLILSPKAVTNMSLYRPDSLFQEQLSVQRSYPCRSYGLPRAVLENDHTQ